MVKTPFGIPVLMMPMLLPCMPVILPLWGFYTLVFGGDEPMKPERLATLTSSMCCLFLISYFISKSPIKTPPIMLASLVITCVSSCSSSIIANDLWKRMNLILAGEKK